MSSDNTVQPILGLQTKVSERLGALALVALQHLMPSIPALFGRFIDAGFLANNVFVLGKPYSTVPRTVNTLMDLGCRVHQPVDTPFMAREYAEHFRATVIAFWKSALKQFHPSMTKLIVLDEGGWLCRDIPESVLDRYSVTAVEHTMSGLLTPPSGERAFPIVLMASSAAKTHFESPVIADAIVDRLSESVGSLHEHRIGIIGLGNIGKAVAACLVSRGVQGLAGFDIVRDKGHRLASVRRVNTLSALVADCDILLGCTGRDALPPEQLEHRPGGSCRLASCSSGNVEFLRIAALLTQSNSANRDPFQDTRGVIGDTQTVLLNGGFPLNFDRSREREHPVSIQLTRELTYASVLQAALCVDGQHSPEAVMLDPDVQKLLVENWLAINGAAHFFPASPPRPLGWWKRNSKGEQSAIGLGKFVTLVRSTYMN